MIPLIPLMTPSSMTEISLCNSQNSENTAYYFSTLF